MLGVRKYVFIGLVFAAIPVTAFILHLKTLGEPPESAAILVYLPFWAGFLSENIVAAGIGLIITLLIWFAIGLGVAFVARRSSKRYFPYSVAIVFISTFFLTVILPWRASVQDQRRFFGIGYTLADCEKVSPELNGGVDQDMCIRSVGTRIMNDHRDFVRTHEPSEGEKFCNAIEDGEMMVDCWRAIGMFHPASDDVCRVQ